MATRVKIVHEGNLKTLLGAATASVDGYATATQITKLDGIEASADVTDATNVAAAGALMASGGMMTGDMTLGENTSVALDPVLSADGKYTGITRTGTAGGALAFGDSVYLDPTDSRWELVDGNIAAGSDGDPRGILGICVLAAAADGDATKILLYGTVRADAVFPTFTINAPVYIGETAGDLVVTQPTTADVVIRVVGFGLTADELFFNPSNEYITHT